jgi:hypothetical protein
MASAPSAETVYFAPRRDILAGNYPLAEPVLLVDADFADQYVGVRELLVAESPAQPDQAPHPADALPIFAIDWHEAANYEGVRVAVVAQDVRASTLSEPTRALVTA